MSSPILSARNVVRRFQLRSGLLGKSGVIHALRGVSLDVGEDECVGLAGESGCGKSSLASILLGLEIPDEGVVRIGGQPIGDLDRLARARLIQPVFQDPYSSLNPRHRISNIVEAPLAIQGEGDRGERSRKVREICDLVGLSQAMIDRFPYELSGGQRQRVAIARALILRPRLVICDEPTSALDVSVQAQILNLLQDLQGELKLGYLFISHDLAVIRHLCSRVVVMQAGQIVEEGPVDTVFESPKRDYTKRLLDSVLEFN